MAPASSQQQQRRPLDPRVDNLLNLLNAVVGGAVCVALQLVIDLVVVNEAAKERNVQWLVALVFYLLVLFVVVSTAVMKALDLLGLLGRSCACVGVRTGDSLVLYRTILQAPFVDLVQGNAKHRAYPVAVWAAIVATIALYALKDIMQPISQVVVPSNTTANLPQLAITSASCRPVEIGTLPPVCVNLTCPTVAADPTGALRGSDPSCSMLPPSAPGLPIGVSAPYVCTVAVAVNDSHGDISSLAAPAIVHAGLANEAFLNGRWNWSAPRGQLNGSINRADVLSQTDGSAVATFSVSLWVVEGASMPHQFVFSTVSSPPSYTEPVSLLNDVSTVAWWWVGLKAGFDGGRAFYALTPSAKPNAKMGIEVVTRFNKAARRLDCNQTWAGAVTPSLHERCTDACYRCRVQTSLCSSQPTFSCSVAFSGQLQSSCNNDEFCGAGPDQLSCLQDAGGASDRSVIMQAWVFVWNTTVHTQEYLERNYMDAYLMERAESDGKDSWRVKPHGSSEDNKTFEELLSDPAMGSWQRADAGQSVLVRRGVKNINGTLQGVLTPQVDVDAMGSAAVDVFFRSGIAAKGVYRVVVVSQGVSSSWDESPNVFVAATPGNPLCSTADHLRNVLPADWQWVIGFDVSVIFLFVLCAVPILHFGQEEVTQRNLLEKRQYGTICSIYLVAFLFFVVVWGVVSLAEAMLVMWLGGCDVNYSFYHLATDIVTTVVYLSVFVTGFRAFVLSADEAGVAKRQTACCCCRVHIMFVSAKRLKNARELVRRILTSAKIVGSNTIRAATTSRQRPPLVVSWPFARVVRHTDPNPAQIASQELAAFDRTAAKLQYYPLRLRLAWYLSLILVCFSFVLVLWVANYLAGLLDVGFWRLYGAFGDAQGNVTLLLEAAVALEYQKNLQEKASGQLPEGLPGVPFSAIRGVRTQQEQASNLFSVYLTVKNKEALQSDLILFGAIGATCGLLQFLYMWLSPWGMFASYREKMVELRRGGPLKRKLKTVSPTAAAAFPALQMFHCLAGFFITTAACAILLWVLFSDFTRTYVWTTIVMALFALFSINTVVKQAAQQVSTNFLTQRSRADQSVTIIRRRVFEKVDVLLFLFTFVTAIALTFLRCLQLTTLNFAAMLRLDTEQSSILADEGHQSYCSMLYMDHAHNNGVMHLFLRVLESSVAEGERCRTEVEQVLIRRGLLKPLSSRTAQMMSFAQCNNEHQLRQAAANRSRRKREVRDAVRLATRQGTLTWSDIRRAGHILLPRRSSALSVASDSNPIAEAESEDGFKLGGCAGTGCTNYQGVLPYNCTACGAPYELHDPRGGLVRRCAEKQDFVPAAFFSSGHASALAWWLCVYLHRFPVLRPLRVQRDRLCDVIAESDDVLLWSTARSSWQKYKCKIDQQYLVLQLPDESSVRALDLTALREDRKSVPALFPVMDAGTAEEDVDRTVRLVGGRRPQRTAEWCGREFSLNWIKRPSLAEVSGPSSDVNIKSTQLQIVSVQQRSDRGGGSVHTDDEGDSDEEEDGDVEAPSEVQRTASNGVAQPSTAVWKGTVTLEDGSSFRNPRDWRTRTRPAVSAGTRKKSSKCPTEHVLQLRFSHVVSPHGFTRAGRECLTMCFPTADQCRRFGSMIEQCWIFRGGLANADSGFSRSDLGIDAAFVAGTAPTDLIRISTWAWMLVGAVLEGRFTPGYKYTLKQLDSALQTASLASVDDGSLVTVALVSLDNLWMYYTDVLEGSYIDELQRGRSQRAAGEEASQQLQQPSGRQSAVEISL